MLPLLDRAMSAGLESAEGTCVRRCHSPGTGRNHPCHRIRSRRLNRNGHAFENSLTLKGKRIEVLLLLHTMAAFTSWLVGMACETAGFDQWLTPFRSRRRLYSIMRLGREALVRRWSNTRLEELMEQIRKPSPALLDQMVVAA
jgi:hypothetical protein